MTNVRYIHGQETELLVEDLVPASMTDAGELAQRRAVAMAHPYYRDFFVTRDGSHVSILARTAVHAGRVEYKIALTRRLRALIAAPEYAAWEMRAVGCADSRCRRGDHRHPRKRGIRRHRVRGGRGRTGVSCFDRCRRAGADGHLAVGDRGNVRRHDPAQLAGGNSFAHYPVVHDFRRYRQRDLPRQRNLSAPPRGLSVASGNRRGDAQFRNVGHPVGRHHRRRFTRVFLFEDPRGSKISVSPWVSAC